MKEINEDDLLIEDIVKKNDFLTKNSFKENNKTEKKKIKLRDCSSLIFEKYFIIKKYNKIIKTIKKENKNARKL